MGVIDVLSLVSQGMTVAIRWPVIWGIVVLCGVSIGYRRRSRFISDVTVSMAQMAAFSWTGAVLTYAAVAASPFPIADALFDHADVALGFHWVGWFNFINARPVLHFLLAHAYTSIPVQALGLIAYLAFSDVRRVHELLLAAMIAILLITPIMFVLPATGEPYHHAATLGQTWFHDIQALRSHSLRRIEDMDGIVFFPSFHTVLGVLFANSVRGHKCFVPLLAVNLLMIASVMSEGAHYGVDMISGFGIACVALAATQWMLRGLGEVCEVGDGV